MTPARHGILVSVSVGELAPPKGGPVAGGERFGCANSRVGGYVLRVAVFCLAEVEVARR